MEQLKIPRTEFVDLNREQRAVDKPLITIYNDLTDADLSKVIHLDRES